MATVFYISPPNYWLSDHVPGASEVPDVGSISLYDQVLDSTTNLFYVCIDATVDAMVWEQVQISLYSGTATLTLGAATVSLPALVSGQKIHLGYQTPGGTPGAVFVSSVTAGTGFTIHSSSLLDASTVFWSVSA